MGCVSAAMAATESALPPRETTLILVAPALAPGNKGRGDEGTAGDIAASDAASEAGGTEDAGMTAGSGLARGVGNASRRALMAVFGLPLLGLRSIGNGAAWVFNRVFLTSIYPGVVVVLRAVANREQLWRTGLRLAWFNKEAVELSVINRYRWPTLVKRWDRGIALVLLQRLQIGQGGPYGPPGLVEGIAAKARQGMKVILVQGENDNLISLDNVRTGIMDAIPGAKLVVMPRCGHVPHEEQPDNFVRLLLEALGADGEQDSSVLEDRSVE